MSSTSIGTVDSGPRMDTVITVAKEHQVPFHYPELFAYHRVPIYDEPGVSLEPWLLTVCMLIDRSIGEGRRVFVHCQVGMSRSAAFVVAYIMYSTGLGYDEALRFVQDRRPIAQPNPGFARTLRTFGKCPVQMTCIEYLRVWHEYREDTQPPLAKFVDQCGGPESFVGGLLRAVPQHMDLLHSFATACCTFRPVTLVTHLQCSLAELQDDHAAIQTIDSSAMNRENRRAFSADVAARCRVLVEVVDTIRGCVLDYPVVSEILGQAQQTLEGSATTTRD